LNDGQTSDVYFRVPESSLDREGERNPKSQQRNRDASITPDPKHNVRTVDVDNIRVDVFTKSDSTSFALLSRERTRRTFRFVFSEYKTKRKTSIHIHTQLQQSFGLSHVPLFGHICYRPVQHRSVVRVRRYCDLFTLTSATRVHTRVYYIYINDSKRIFIICTNGTVSLVVCIETTITNKKESAIRHRTLLK